MFKNVYKKIICFLLGFLAFSSVVVAQSNNEQLPVIWGIKYSPYVRKTLLAMELKGLQYELRETLPGRALGFLGQPVPEGFKNASPLGKIPAYQEKDFGISDSSVILAYLEKAYPESSLYPQDAKQLAQALWLEEYSDTVIGAAIAEKIYTQLYSLPTFFGMAPDQALVQETLEKEMPPIYDYLESILSKSNGKMLLGDKITVADVAVGGQFAAFRQLNIEIDSQRWPLLAQYLDNLFATPAFCKVMDRCQ